ncbi:MAG: hypothetical protein UR81_C0022G0002 [Candidatus Levybacteria bacterium GW2011_GWB1_35_5]|nr:MAG: hypothetical protein UR81_C0022G0002 [Candidatus Levybacteria bacterium GW2011_GWB1_35_5]
MEQHENLHRNKKEIIINNFIGGIAWAVGATVGLAIIVAILGLILQNINLVPFVGNFIADIINFIIDKRPDLVR